MAIGEAVVAESTIVAEERTAEREQRYNIQVYGKWCKGCGLCIAFCPQEVFAEDEFHHPVVAHPEQCVACGWCTTHCPDFAILVEKAGGSKGQIGK